jgi:hypothetical protein
MMHLFCPNHKSPQLHQGPLSAALTKSPETETKSPGFSNKLVVAYDDQEANLGTDQLADSCKERERERERECVCVKKSQIIYNLSSPLGDPIPDQTLPLFSTYTHHTLLQGSSCRKGQ